MRSSLDKTLRSKLEKTVENAREIVEVAVDEALTRLGVGEGAAPGYLTEAERKLRTRLRAHGRQLGDALHKDSGKQETESLTNEMAYEHWHRMLFARFLEQSNLLMYDQNTNVTLEECKELAEEGDPLGDVSDVKDGWDLAGRLAEKMLPQIFRADSPVFDVKLSINHINDLEELVAALHLDTFQASDALGWCYQFWQNKKKKQVNESGVKIGAKELSTVTQLFTEPYMVSFLLDNALGAWWAKRRLTTDDLQTASSEQELRERVAIPGVPLEYLRFVQDADTKTWSSAAGDFEQWPTHLSELKTLDPCCGSGHFLVAIFLMLVPMRMQLEGLTAKQAIDKVLSENIHGLELDQRCVELAAFALALEAWRYPNSGGYRQLPELQLACSGMSINEAQKEWKELAKGNEELEGAVRWMQQTFKQSPILGSLIDPTKALKESKNTPWSLLQEATSATSDASEESKAKSQGLALASELLADNYHWIVTNVPYKKAADLCTELQVFLDCNYPAGCVALETSFVERCKELTKQGGTNSIVLPQNWMFLTTYKKFRKKLLTDSSVLNIIRLGSGAFETISGEVVKALLLTTSNEQKEKNEFFSLDVADQKLAKDKAKAISEKNLKVFNQKAMLTNPDHRIVIEEQGSGELFSLSTGSYVGLQNGDTDRFIQKVWEHSELNERWSFFQMPTTETSFYSGRYGILLWENGSGSLVQSPQAYVKGREAWGKPGVAIRLTKPCPTSIYSGNLYDQSSAALIPQNQSDLVSVFCYTKSEDFKNELEKIDQKRNVTNATFVKVPFDKAHWKEEAIKEYPNGLPKPFTNDFTQWIFHGHPCASVIWDEEKKSTNHGDLRQDDAVLQIAVARLLGYRWPAELDAEMELAPEMREVVAKCKDFDDLVDDDGIVCIPAIRGEKPANDRLQAILQVAYGESWSASVLNNLLKSVKAANLTSWLRDKFFEQHCKIFQHRPFIWHIWDGLADGFSALVNYHTLDYKGLERLIYTYLDDWISTQIQLEKDGVEGAELRLSAARNLKQQLEAILVGEKGLDIFVRWKPLAEQPIGWNPDLNDGVRLNIRPFMYAKDVGKKEAGVLRTKPNIHWKKDRGTDVASAPWFDLGPTYGGNPGDRINDHHLTLAEKKAARESS